LLFGALIGIELLNKYLGLWHPIPAIIVLSAQGLCFGSYFGIFPTAVDNIYGNENYGKHMSIIQFGTGTISFLTPVVTTTLFKVWNLGSFMYLNIFYAIILFLISILMLIVPCEPYPYKNNQNNL